MLEWLCQGLCSEQGDLSQVFLNTFQMLDIILKTLVK